MNTPKKLSIRSSAGTVALVLLTGSMPGLAVEATPAEIPIVDTHTHFYDPSRPEGVPWPGKGSPLFRTVLPGDFRALKKFRPVRGTVVVEASKWVEDNAWLLALGESEPQILGIVGNLNPLAPSFAADLARFSANPLFRGIRVSEQSLETVLNRGELQELSLLAERKLTLDVIGGPSMPALAAKVARRMPHLTLVLDHMGGVPITESPLPSEWVEGIRAAGACGNVYCKVSGMMESAAVSGKRPAPRDPAFYRPYLDAVWQAFGTDRVLYGSNWPVCELGADYETVQRLAIEYANEKGPDAVAKFCSGNSQRAYRWADR